MGCALSTEVDEPSSPRADAAAKAKESAARLAAMMAELGIDQDNPDAVTISRDRVRIAALQRHWYGIEPMSLSNEQYHLYLRTVLAIAAADGVNDAEKEWLRMRMDLLGLTMLQRNRMLAKRVGGLRSVLKLFEELRDSISSSATGFSSTIARLVYYDAICMASQTQVADPSEGGFTLDERLRARDAASVLRLSESVRSEIETLVDVEAALLRRRRRFLLESRATAHHLQEAAPSRPSSHATAFAAERRWLGEPLMHDHSSQATGAIGWGSGNQASSLALASPGRRDAQWWWPWGAPPPLAEAGEPIEGGVAAMAAASSTGTRSAIQRLLYGVELPGCAEVEGRYVQTLLSVAGIDGA